MIVSVNRHDRLRHHAFTNSGARYARLAPLILLFLTAAGSFDKQIFGETFEVFQYGIVLISCAFISSVAVFYYFRRLRLNSVSYVGIVFYCYVTISFTWTSMDFDSTVKLLLFVATSIASLCIILAYDDRRVILALFYALLILISLGVIAAVLFPEVGQMHSFQHAGKWKGIFVQKNMFGRYASFLLFLSILMLAFPRYFGHSRYIQLLATVGLLVGCLSLANAGSRGALLFCGVLLVLFGVGYFLMKRVGRIFIVLLAASLVLASPYAIAFIELLDSEIVIGENVISFNNRNELWKFGLFHLNDRLLFGFGNGGFWTDERVMEFATSYGWVLDNFHNGFINLAVELGLVGLVLFVFLIVFSSIIILTRLKYSVTEQRAGAIFRFCYFFGFLVVNLFETVLLRSTNLMMILFSIVIFQSFFYDRQPRR